MEKIEEGHKMEGQGGKREVKGREGWERRGRWQGKELRGKEGGGRKEYRGRKCKEGWRGRKERVQERR